LIKRLFPLLLLALSLQGAEFVNGQAARAVIGQSSFSSQEPGIIASTLAVSDGRLVVTDFANRVSTLDLQKLLLAAPDPAEPATAAEQPRCTVCGFALTSADMQVFPHGSPAVATRGNTVIVADAVNHRVLVWRDVTRGSNLQTPDVVLGDAVGGLPVSATTLGEPVSVAFDGKRLFVGDAALRRVLVWNSLPAANHQAADAVLGQIYFSSVDSAGNPAADNLGPPSALAADGGNLFVADTLNRRILVFTAADTPVARNAVRNSASLSPGPLAPGTLITISGEQLSDGSEAAEDDGIKPLPAMLGGTQVIFDGQALPLLSVSPDQVRAQIPYQLAGRSAAMLYLRTEHPDGSVSTTNAIGVRIVPANPGVFAFGGIDPRSGLVLHAPADPSGEPGPPVTEENPAKPGETIVLWATGLGSVESRDDPSKVAMGVPYAAPGAPVANTVAALVAGRSAEVSSATLPHGAIGVYEVRIVLPADLPSDRKTELSVFQDGMVSNTILLPVGAERE